MGTIVGCVLISYDIEKSHLEVKTALEKLGYLEKFKSTNDPTAYKLPNTTLWHPKKSSDQAMIDLRTTCEKLNVPLEKAIVVKALDFVGYC